MNSERQPIIVGDVTIRPNRPTIMAGPCAVESEEQTMAIAQKVVSNGAKILRGGAFKPRTSPDAFQGLGETGLDILFRAGRTFGVPVVTEIMDKDQIELIENASKKHPFIFQIGSRNAQNFNLLSAVGKTGCHVETRYGSKSGRND